MKKPSSWYEVNGKKKTKEAEAMWIKLNAIIHLSLTDLYHQCSLLISGVKWMGNKGSWMIEVNVSERHTEQTEET